MQWHSAGTEERKARERGREGGLPVVPDTTMAGSRAARGATQTLRAAGRARVGLTAARLLIVACILDVLGV